MTFVCRPKKQHTRAYCRIAGTGIVAMLSLLLFAAPANAFTVNGGSRTRSTSLTMASKGKKVRRRPTAPPPPIGAVACNVPPQNLTVLGSI